MVKRNVIDSFSDDYNFLSNFYPVKLLMDGKIYPSLEHAFQAAKTRDRGWRAAIRKANSPNRAKRIGKWELPFSYLRKDWDSIKDQVMLQLLRQKFSRGSLKEQLLATGSATLIEGNNWGDVYWGCVYQDDYWLGHNNLGNLLMKVRSELSDGDQSGSSG